MSSLLAFPSKNEDAHGAFAFKPHLDSRSSSFPSAEKKVADFLFFFFLVALNISIMFISREIVSF